MKYNIKKKFLISLFTAIMIFGTIISSGNYEWSVTFVDEEVWTDADPINDNHARLIEDTFAPASTTIADYVDSVYSEDFGSMVDEPPDGMGDSGTGTSSDTEFTEESYLYNSYGTLEQQDFSGSGWTATYMSYTASTVYADTTSSTRSIESGAWDVSSHDGIRMRVRYRGDIVALESGDYVAYIWTGSWVKMGNLDGAWESYVYDYFEQATSYNAVKVKVESNTADSGEVIEIDQILVQYYDETTGYKLDITFKFSDVDYGYDAYNLYVDFRVISSEVVDVYIGPLGSLTLVGDDKQDDFSVDVVNYITDDEIYMRIVDTTQAGDSAQTTFYIQRCYLSTTNYAAEIDDSPACTNFDEESDLYARYKAYTFTANVSDDNGYGHIDYVDLSLISAADTAYWTVRYTTGSGWSETVGTSYIELVTGSCEAVASGDDLDLTFAIKIEWAHTSVTNYDLKLEVVDYNSEGADTEYNVNYLVDCKLEFYTTAYVTDGSGTLDRGNLDGTFTIVGDYNYYESYTNLRPPNDEVDVWVSCSEYGSNVGPWVDDTLNSGDFAVTCYADDSVGIDDYLLKPVADGAGSGGDSLYLSGSTITKTYISDQLTVSITNPTDQRINIGDNATTIEVSAVYQYPDSTEVFDGDILLNDTIYDHGVVGIYYYTADSVGNDTHGVTTIGTNDDTYCIFDALTCYVSVPDDQRIDVGENCTGLEIWAVYEYDGALFNGTLELNNTNYEYSVVGIQYYNVTTASGGVYGIDVISNNGNQTYCIWDALIAYVSVPDDQRINVGENCTGLIIWAVYSYDGDTYSGNLTLNDTTYDYGVVGIYYYNVTIADGLDTYGITVITSGGNQTYCIFDSLIAYVSVPDDQRINIGANCTGLTIWAVYSYDNTAYSGVLTLNDTTYDYSTVGIYYYNVTSADDSDAYNITVISNNGNYTYCIFDSLTAYITTPDDQRIDIGANCTGLTIWAVYNYDSATFDGDLELNDTTYDYGVVGIYYYNVTTAENDTYGISVITNGGNQTYCIFDSLTCYVTEVTDQRGSIGDNATGMVLSGIWNYDSGTYDGTLTLNNTDYDGDGTVTRWDYNVTIAAGDDSYGITVIAASNTTYMIWDNAIVLGYNTNSTDNRDDINIGVNVSVWIQYEYDSTNITDGTVVISGDAFAYNADSGNWTAIFSNATASAANWTTIVVTGNTYGIESENQNGKYQLFIWDSYTIAFTVDNRISVNENASVTYTVLSDYDGISYDGTVTLNYSTWVQSTVGRWNFTVSSLGGDDSYSITTISTNDEDYVIWDSLIAYVTQPTDQRIDVNSNCTGLTVWANYTYDNTVYDGTLELNDTTYDHSSVGIYYYNVTVANGDDTYNITVISNSGNETYCIFDQIEVYSDGCDYDDTFARINVGQNVTLWANARLQYDNHELGTGDTIHFGDEIMAWNGTHFTASYTKYEVGLFVYTLNDTGSSEATYGITVGVNNPVNLIFDRILVYDMWLNTTYCDVGNAVLVAAALVSEYDNSSMTTGLVQLNGTLGTEVAGDINMTYVANCTWTNETIMPSYGGWIFEITFANWTTYNLTTINYNGWNITYLLIDTDRIIILTTTVSDSRIDYGTTMMINVTAKLEFRGDMLNGSDTLYMNDTLMTWDVDHFYYTTSAVQSVSAYMFYVNTTGAYQTAFGISTLNLDDNNVTIIWDRVIWTAISTNTTDIKTDNWLSLMNLNETVTVYATLAYEYDNTPVNTGTISNTFGTWTYNGTDGDWYFIKQLTNYTTAVNITDGAFTISGNTYGITVFTPGSVGVTNYIACVRITDTSVAGGYGITTNDTRTNINDVVRIQVNLQYYQWANYTVNTGTAYLTDGTTQYALTYNGTTGYWDAYIDKSSVSSYTFQLYTNCTDTTWGITTSYATDTQAVIWDQIIVVGYNTNSTDDRDDIGTYVNVSVWLQYSYDSTNVTTGTVVINGDVFTYIGSGGNWSAIFMNTTTSGATWDTVVISGETYDIVSVNQNSKSQLYIWDRVIATMAVNMTWTVVTYYVNVSFTGIYEYDSTVWSGFATVANTSLTTGSVVRYEKVTNNTVVNNTFYITAVEDSAVYYLTEFTTTTVWCVWDNITVNYVDYYTTVDSINKKLYIVFGALSWSYNSSGIGESWTCYNLRNGTYISLATTSTGSILSPQWQEVIVPLSWAGISYTNNATRTINGVDYNFQWYSLDVEIIATLIIRNLLQEILESDISVSGHINTNVTYTVYNENIFSGESGQLNVTSEGVEDGFQFSFAKYQTLGQHNFSILFTSVLGGNIQWFNQSYEITFDIDIEIPEQKTLYMEIKGISNLDCEWYVYNRDDADWTGEDGTIAGGNDYFQFLFLLETAAGMHNYSIYFNITDTTYVWKNGTYYISEVYGYMTFNLYDGESIKFTDDAYKIYVNGTRVFSDTIFNRTDYVYSVEITDYFNYSVLTGTYDYERFVDIELAVYTFKVYSMVADDDYFYFNLTRSGGATFSQHLLPGEILIYRLVTGTYTYEFTRTKEGTSALYTGDIALTTDTSYVVTDVGLSVLLQDVLRDASGSANTKPLMSALAGLDSGLAFLQATLWGIAGLIIAMMVISGYMGDETTVKGGKVIKKKRKLPKHLERFKFKRGPQNPQFKGIPAKAGETAWAGAGVTFVEEDE